MKIRFWLWLFFIPAGAYALDAESCVGAALRDTNLVVQNSARERAAYHTFRSDTAARLPGFSAGLDAVYLTNTLQETLSLQVDFDLSKLLAGNPALSYYDLERTRLENAVNLADVRRNVVETYAALYAAVQKKKGYEKAVEYFTSHISLMERLQSRGVGNGLDLARARIRLRGLQDTIRGIDSDVDSALLDLNGLTGGSFTANDLASMQAPLTNLSGLAGRELTNSSFYRLAALELEVKKEIYRRSVYASVPGASLSAAYTLDNASPRDSELQFTLSASMNVFGFGSLKEANAALLGDYEAQQNTFALRVRDMKLELERRLQDYDAQTNRYVSAGSAFRLAESDLPLANSLYEQGKLTETDLLDVFSDYTDLYGQLYDLLYACAFDAAELDYLLGD